MLIQNFLGISNMAFMIALLAKISEISVHGVPHVHTLVLKNNGKRNILVSMEFKQIIHSER